MRLVIQRVAEARVEVESKVVGQIQAGMLVFLGIGQGDSREIADQLIQKILPLRIFEDEHQKMNLSAQDVNASFLIVSQFTLYGDLRKGRRPSFDGAAAPQEAKELYHYFVDQLKAQGAHVETGQFAAMMDVSLVNDGPVTFVLDSEEK